MINVLWAPVLVTSCLLFKIFLLINWIMFVYIKIDFSLLIFFSLAHCDYILVGSENLWRRSFKTTIFLETDRHQIIIFNHVGQIKIPNSKCRVSWNDQIRHVLESYVPKVRHLKRHRNHNENYHGLTWSRYSRPMWAV